MPSAEYIKTLKSLLEKEHYENYGVTDYLSFPEAVHPEKVSLVEENYNKKYKNATGVQLFFLNPASVSTGTLKNVTKNIRSKKFSECSNFAAGAAGLILEATEKGLLSDDMNITIAGISDLQNHNVVLIYPKDMDEPKTWPDFWYGQDKILIIDPWAFALGHGDSCMYTVNDYPLAYMLTKATTHYQSRNDDVHLKSIVKAPSQPLPTPVVIPKPMPTPMPLPLPLETQLPDPITEPGSEVSQDKVENTEKTEDTHEETNDSTKNQPEERSNVGFYFGMALAGTATGAGAFVLWLALVPLLVSAGVIVSNTTLTTSVTTAAFAVGAATYAFFRHSGNAYKNLDESAPESPAFSWD